MFEEYKDVVGIDELCKMLGVGRNKAYALIKNGVIKSFTIGKVKKIPKSWIVEYIINSSN